jgi:hydrogenase-4 component B
MVLLALACAAVLLSTAALSVVIADEARARLIVYGVCLIASLTLLSIALLGLLGFFDAPSAATLPLGIPWLGAHFRVDALSAFFLAVVNLGAAAASLSRWDTVATSTLLAECCRSIRHFWPA